MKYFVGFLMTLGLTILLIILLIGGDKKPATTSTSQSLVDYAGSGVVVRLLVDGPINSTREHQQVSFTVGNDQVTYKEFTGYNGQVVDSRTFSNTSESYAVFLKTLNLVGFTKGDDTKEHQDERGYCPLGNRYIYEITDGSKNIQRYWSTSCRKAKTYLGDDVTTLQLFKNQVPGYQKIQQTFSF